MYIAYNDIRVPNMVFNKRNKKENTNNPKGNGEKNTPFNTPGQMEQRPKE